MQPHAFESSIGPHIRFREYLKDCRESLLQEQCMEKEIKNQGRQVPVLIESQRKVPHLDRMRKIIDSDDGEKLYSRRMHTIDEQLLLHCLPCLHSLRPVA